MQVQFDHIAGGEPLLGQAGKEEFVDHAPTGDANRTLLLAGRMSRHHDAAWHALGSHWHRRAVIEGAHGLAFGALLGLIWGEVQTRLNERMIKHAVLFATGHESEASQINEYGPSPILAVEPQQGALRWELIHGEIPTNGAEPLAQFLPIATVPPVAKRTEPVVTMSLRNRCACPDHLPTLAVSVARSTDARLSRRKAVGRSSV